MDLFDVYDNNARLFNLFDGQRNIGTIGLEYSQGSSLTREEAFIEARCFFLRLVSQGICLPSNPLPE